MPISLARGGTSLGVGVVAGVADKQLAPMTLGTTPLKMSTVVEGLALVGGFVLQFMMPFTAPNIADGLVDGSLALLGQKAVANYLPAGSAHAYSMPRFAPMVGYNGSGMVGAGARPFIGSVTSQVPKVKLS